MARQNRKWYPGAIYHIMNRGNRKAVIFKDEGDYRFFLEQVKTVKTRYPFIIHSICLMPNHFHIEMETEQTEPGKIMGRLLSTYATFFNSKYSLSGHLFGGRYKSVLIENENYFLEVCRYIHLNPVKANITKSPLDYIYSSYSLYAADKGQVPQDKVTKIMEEIVDPSRVLGCFGNDRERYKSFVEGGLSHKEQELLIMKDINENEE